MTHSLYLGNVPESADEKSLTKEFAACGTVVGVNLVKDRATGAHKGYAFVEMATAEEAQQAIKDLNGKSVDGKALVVNIAKPNATVRKNQRGAGPANRGPGGHPGAAGGRGNRW
jgi:RNA recognition motif-containing protein